MAGDESTGFGGSHGPACSGVVRGAAVGGTLFCGAEYCTGWYGDSMTGGAETAIGFRAYREAVGPAELRGEEVGFWFCRLLGAQCPNPLLRGAEAVPGRGSMRAGPVDP